jgi:hypothetical protein
MPTITIVDKPTPIQTSLNSNNQARERAVAALLGGTGNAQATPVADPNNVSVEDLQATQTKQTDNSVVEETATDSQEATAQSLDPSKDASSEDAKTETAPPLSTQYAILARKEEALRARAIQQDQAIKAREDAIAAREVELQSKANPDLSNYISKDKIKQNAYGVLTELGLTYDEITQQALASQSPDAQLIRQMREELAEELKGVKEEQAKTRQIVEEQNTKAYQQAVSQITSEVKQLVKLDPSFELIKAKSAHGDVVQLIERTFHEDGVLMSVEEAAQAVEDYLVEEAFKDSQVGKIQARLKKAAEAKPQPKTVAVQQQNAQPQIKTLTNAVGSTRPLTARERALLAFKGELK